MDKREILAQLKKIAAQMAESRKLHESGFYEAHETFSLAQFDVSFLMLELAEDIAREHLAEPDRRQPITTVARKTYCIDNGVDAMSAERLEACIKNEITVVRIPPHDPRMKGRVEREFTRARAANAACVMPPKGKA